MNRRLLVLKMLTLAMEELVAKGESLHTGRITDLAMVYGRGINLEGWELEPFFKYQIVEALEAD